MLGSMFSLGALDESEKLFSHPVEDPVQKNDWDGFMQASCQM